MRHLVRGKKIGRDVSHRKATLQALSVALIKEHRIVTTVSKAKELRRYVEPIITRAKEDTTHNRRQAFSKLQDKEAVSHLFDEVGPKCKGRPGGYTRVVKAGFRKGDGAELAVMELVDYNDIKPEGASGNKKKTRRAGKSNKPTSSEPKAKSKKKKKKDKVKEEEEEEEEKTEAASDEAGAETESAEEAAAQEKKAQAEEKEDEDETKTEAKADAETEAEAGTEDQADEDDEEEKE